MLHSPRLIDQMFLATGGDVCRYGGRDANGHFETPVDEVEPYNPGAATLIATPSFVCANGILPDIGYDEREGARGVGATVAIRVRDGDTGELGPPRTWRVTNVVRRDEDGGEIRLLLSEE